MNDPNSWIEAALEEMKGVLAGKNKDYRIDGEFSNFKFAAEVAGITTYQAIMCQIGIKLGRLKGLEGKADVNYETLHDTVMDLHGYAAILHGYSIEGDFRWYSSG